jgi:hypothetical protein
MGRTESMVKVPKYQISAVKKGVESARQSGGELRSSYPRTKIGHGLQIKNERMNRENDFRSKKSTQPIENAYQRAKG